MYLLEFMLEIRERKEVGAHKKLCGSTWPTSIKRLHLYIFELYITMGPLKIQIID